VSELVTSGAAPPRSLYLDRRYRWYHTIGILLIPAVLLAINPNLFVNPGGNSVLDPWVYTGLFISLPSHLRRFGETYYATRLPWLLPGFLTQYLFSPLTGNYVLHLSFFGTLLFATYRLVSRGVDRSAGFIAAVLVAGSPSILAALSWDYVDGPGIVFLVIALCCLNEAAHDADRSRLWPFAAGAALSCLVASNLTLGALLPACAVFVLVLTSRSGWRSMAAMAAIGVAGAALTMALLAVANRLLGGQWFFPEASFAFGRLVRSAPNRWRTPGFDWSRATWLALPAVAAVGAGVDLVMRRRQSSRFQRAAQAALLVALATFVFLDTVGDWALLQFFYYASVLTPLALIALVAQAGPRPADDGWRGAVPLEMAAIAIMCGGYALSIRHTARFWTWVQASMAWGPPRDLLLVVFAATIVSGLMAIVAVHVIGEPRLRWGVFLVLAALSVSSLSQYWPVDQVPNARLEYQETVTAHRFIASRVGEAAMRIWHAAPTATSPPFRSIACTFLCSRLLVNEALPLLTRDEAQAMAPPMRLVLIVARESDAADARTALRAFGLDYTVVAQQQIGLAERAFLVIVADMVSVQTHA
jgi:hypothetical protein